MLFSWTFDILSAAAMGQPDRLEDGRREGGRGGEEGGKEGGRETAHGLITYTVRSTQTHTASG